MSSGKDSLKQTVPQVPKLLKLNYFVALIDLVLEIPRVYPNAHPGGT